MKKKIASVLVLVAIVIIVSLFVYVEAVPRTRHLTVDGYDYFFTVQGLSGNNPTIIFRSGDVVNLTLVNAGSKEDHEFFILAQADFDNYTKRLELNETAQEPLPAFPNGSVEDVPANQSKTGTFVVGAPGTYVYACLDKHGTDPLTHANKGMYGTLIVEDGGFIGATKSMAASLSSILMAIPAVVIWQIALLAALIAAVIGHDSEEKKATPES